MKKIKLETLVEVHEDYTLMGELEQQLFALAKQARDRAYAPYSKFRVGAAVLLDDGQIYEGNNQENAAYPSGLCAERVALYYAAANNPTVPITAIAIAVAPQGQQPLDIVAPCGSCRQSIVEYEYRFQKNIKLYLLGQAQKVYVIQSIKDILPFAFSNDFL